MSNIARYALGYLGPLRLIVLAVSGVLFLIIAIALVAYSLAQSLFVTAIVAYVAMRGAYETSFIPLFPKASTVALRPAYSEQGRVAKVVKEARIYVDNGNCYR
jgi:hypothetical protein